MAAKTLVTSAAFRFSIRQLLTWTAVVALACVALRNASPTWVAALLGLVLIVLAATVPLVVFRHGPQRAYWLGFALFGWLYVLLLAYSWSLDPKAAASNPLAPRALATTFLSSYGYERIYGTKDVMPISYRLAFSSAGSAGPVLEYAPSAGLPTSLSAPEETAVLAAIDPASDFFSNLGLVSLSGQTVDVEPSRDDFVNVAHAFWTLLLAAVGGWFTRWLYATRAAAPQIRAQDQSQPI